MTITFNEFEMVMRETSASSNLRLMIEKLKCCGNCLHYKSMIGADTCTHVVAVTDNMISGDGKPCEFWEFGL